MMSLIFGGAGSGKSAFAERLTGTWTWPRLYLATMIPRDEESRARIDRHRQMRADKGFKTLERYRDLPGAEIPKGANVLLEDLSNLLANEMFDRDGGGAAAVWRGLQYLEEQTGHLIIVSNDVFSGGAGYQGETLTFLRELACLHRHLAARADLVAEVVCGRADLLKGAAVW